MTTLREAAQQALEVLEDWDSPVALPAIVALRAALAQEQAAQTWVCPDSAEHRYKQPGHCEDCGKTLVLAQAEPVQEPVAYTTGHCKERAKPGGCQLHNLHCGYPKCDRKSAQEQAEPVQEPYTDDVTRIMREAGMTFHLGLPHKAVVEQMTRVIDLVYAETSIKAAQQFAAAPPQRKPLTEEEIDRITDQQWGAANGQRVHYAAFRTYARAIERALEEKNRGR